MNEPKPFASLSPSLLARKGGARPAMRPQFMPLSHDDQRRMGFASSNAAPVEDDLGWNDHGEDVVAVSAEAEVVAIAADPLPEPAQPEVLRRIESLDSAMRAESAKASVATDTLTPAGRRPRGAALKEGRKAAFTLRIDAERHLRLRLACTIENRSAQQIVVEALDHFLETKPGLADLARRARHS